MTRKSASKVELLINCIKQYPEIYDPSNLNYKKPKVKETIWKEIATTLDDSSEGVKKKWKNIRDTYVRYLKSKTKEGRDSRKNYRNWQWARSMEQFRPYMNVSSTRNKRKKKWTNFVRRDSIYLSDFKEKESEEEFMMIDTDDNKDYNFYNFEHLEINIDESDENFQIDQTLKTEDSAESSSICEYGVINAIPSTIHRIQEFSQQLPEDLRTKKATQINIDDLDATELTFLGYAKTLKTFPPLNQTMIKMKIANLILKEELRLQYINNN